MNLSANGSHAQEGVTPPTKRLMMGGGVGALLLVLALGGFVVQRMTTSGRNVRSTFDSISATPPGDPAVFAVPTAVTAPAAVTNAAPAPDAVAPRGFNPTTLQLTGTEAPDPRTCGNNIQGRYELTYADCVAPHNVRIVASSVGVPRQGTDGAIAGYCQAELWGWAESERGLGKIERISFPQADGQVLHVCFIRFQ
jgi:hypothetical protein